MRTSGRTCVFRAIAIGSLIVWALTACVATTASESCGTNVIVADATGESFATQYAPGLVLPIPEADFLSLVRDRELKFTRLGAQGKLPLFKPRHCNSINMAAIGHGYLVHGGYDSAKGRVEDYLVLVDITGQITYIENRYQYSASP